MKKLKGIIVVLIMAVMLVGCGNKVVTPDYTETEAETALNAGEDLEGKTVKIKVKDFIPDGAMGYTIHAGEHLNFVSPDNPKIEIDDEMTVKIVKVTSMLGSFIMTYEKL